LQFSLPAASPETFGYTLVFQAIKLQNSKLHRRTFTSSGDETWRWPYMIFHYALILCV